MARKRPKNRDERAEERTEHAADELNIPPPPDEDTESLDEPLDEASKAKNRRETGPPAQLDE